MADSMEVDQDGGGGPQRAPTPVPAHGAPATHTQSGTTAGLMSLAAGPTSTGATQARTVTALSAGTDSEAGTDTTSASARKRGRGSRTTRRQDKGASSSGGAGTQEKTPRGRPPGKVQRCVWSLVGEPASRWAQAQPCGRTLTWLIYVHSRHGVSAGPARGAARPVAGVTAARASQIQAVTRTWRRRRPRRQCLWRKGAYNAVQHAYIRSFIGQDCSQGKTLHGAAQVTAGCWFVGFASCSQYITGS